jgi:molybdopterin-guanine dinucleotide biosynthesis protein A
MGAGAVLCGGESSRMGTPKACLPLGPSALLAHVVQAVSAAAHPVVVVAARGQQLPPLPADVRVLRDPVSGRGPLQAIAVALAALAPDASHAFVAATDAPFLHPAFVRRMFELCAGHDAAVVEEDGRLHPLAAVYATALAAEAERLLGAGERRLTQLLERAATRRVTRAELLADAALRAEDPGLRSLVNVNTPADYEQAVRTHAGRDR